MSDLGELYAVVALLFAAESFYLVDYSSISLSKRFFAKWKWTNFNPRSIYSFPAFTCAWSGVSPLSRLLLAQTSPICIGLEGVVGYPVHTLSGVPHNPTMLYVPWVDAHRINRDGKKLLFGKDLLARFGSEKSASSKLELIKQVALEPSNKRRSAIQSAISAEFNNEVAADRYEALSHHFRDELVLNCVTTIFLLVVFPVVTVLGWFALHWSVLLALLFVLCVSTAILHAMNTSKFGRVPLSAVSTLVFFPVSACRSAQRHIAYAMSDFHPIVVAKLLLKPKDFYSRYAEMLRDLRHPQGVSRLEPGLRSRVLETRELYLDELTKLAGIWKVDLDMSVPKVGSSLIGYCPRCLQQYTRKSGDCSDCVDVLLLPAMQSEVV